MVNKLSRGILEISSVLKEDGEMWNKGGKKRGGEIVSCARMTRETIRLRKEYTSGELEQPVTA